MISKPVAIQLEIDLDYDTSLRRVCVFECVSGDWLSECVRGPEKTLWPDLILIANPSASGSLSPLSTPEPENSHPPYTHTLTAFPAEDLTQRRQTGKSSSIMINHLPC